MSLFPTKFVADVDTLQVYSDNTLEAKLKVNGTVVLSETYSPANGQIIVRGLRSVLEAAIYGELGGSQDHASAIVELTIGNNTFTPPGGYLFASRLRNPRDPNGANTILAAGDLVAVLSGGSFITPAQYCSISGSTVQVNAVNSGASRISLGNGVNLWVEHDVPQTMMTPLPLDIKPGFSDQASMMYGRQVRYSVDQNDEYILRSGEVHSQEEYASWSDLATSRKAEVLMNGQWVPIIVTKTNYTQIRRSMGRNRVEISFKMADPRQGL